LAKCSGTIYAIFRLTQGLGVFCNKRQILPNLVAEAMEKRPIIFFMLFVTLLFAFACAYSPFDKVREVDLFSDKKYEDLDIEVLYAEKEISLEGVLVSATLFSPFSDIFFEFLPSFFSPNTLLVTTFWVLRC
jgi:hypothetical protein